MTTELNNIPYVRKCFYLAYADFPSSGLKEGDLAFATDRLVLYRWDGSAWDAITIHASSGTAAAIPAAADLPDGSLYYETDTSLLKQVQSGAWASITPTIPASSTTGTFTGDGTNNRAIPHGLGQIPSLVVVANISDKDELTFTAYDSGYHVLVRTGPTITPTAITANTATNLYVWGNDDNQSGKSYKWVAIP